MDKKQLFNFLRRRIHDELNEFNAELNSIDQEIEKETKSSAGDKFETSREMMSQERDRLAQQINYKKSFLKLLGDSDLKMPLSKVEWGSLIELEDYYCLFGIPIGQIEFKGDKIFCISANSPLGKALLNKKKADIIKFNNTSLKIKSIQ